MNWFEHHRPGVAETSISFESFVSGGALNVYGAGLQFHGGDGVNKRANLFEKENCGDSGYLHQEYSNNQEKTAYKGIQLSEDQYHRSNSDFKVLGDCQFDFISTAIQPFKEPATLPSVPTITSSVIPKKEEKPSPMHFPSLGLLNYKSRFKRLKNEQELNHELSETSTSADGPRLSTVEVMRVAGARYVQLFIDKDDDLSMLKHPFGCALSGLTHEEIEDVELAHLLLASAEKVGNQHYDRASKLLNQCTNMASITGNPVQRVAYYFAKTLQERIQKETGRPISSSTSSVNVEEELLSPCPAVLAYYRALPLTRAMQFAGMQTIIETVASAKRVHLIDLCVRSGMHLTVLMQALASSHSCPLELFKVTAFATTSPDKVEETGTRLANFAENVKLPFVFNVLMVSSNMEDLKEDSMLEYLEPDELVVVFSPMFLNNLIVKPDQLERLMKPIKKVSPSLMVVTEIEANHNSRSFVTRFTETLFFYSAFFDSLEACMERNDEDRVKTEGVMCAARIRNIVANEGEERTKRHVGIDVWRPFFERFAMVETPLSQSALYQARLILERSDCGSFCTLDVNGESLLVGWKGTPIFSLSVWKFQ